MLPGQYFVVDNITLATNLQQHIEQLWSSIDFFHAANYALYAYGHSREGAGCVFYWWARIQNWSIQIGDNGPWASQQTRGLCCIYSKLDQDARIAWLLVLPSSPMGTQSAYIAPLPRAQRTKNQKYAGISLSVKHLQLRLQHRWIILSGQGRPGQGALLHNNQGETVRVRAGPGPWAAPGLNLETFCEERIPASAQSNARRSRVRGRICGACEMRLWLLHGEMLRGPAMAVSYAQWTATTRW